MGNPQDEANCAQPMRLLRLAATEPGHEPWRFDLCGPCRLVWCNPDAPAAIGPRGWTELLEAMTHEQLEADDWFSTPI